jgi:hypothetical protein
MPCESTVLTDLIPRRGPNSNSFQFLHDQNPAATAGAAHGREVIKSFGLKILGAPLMRADSAYICGSKNIRLL